jgi:hypothetical protein
MCIKNALLVVQNGGYSIEGNVQIGPDSEQIYQTLKALVLNPERIDAIKEKSREFAVNHCETSHIAQRYLECVGLANKA